MPPAVRGTLSDRPWGVTLGVLAARGLTGQLEIHAEDGKTYRVGFLRGAIVAASSPLAADSIARIALTSHLVTSTDVTSVQRRITAAPDRDEIEVLAEAARLSGVQVEALRRRAITQRAARTFAVERGSFVLEPTVTLAMTEGVEVDVGAVIFLGARMNLAQARLENDLREMGSRFTSRPPAGDMTRFGFTAAEQPILDELVHGTTLPELDARFRDIEPRTMQAVVYALVSTGDVEASGVRAAPAAEPARTKTITLEPPRTTTERGMARQTTPPAAVASEAAAAPDHLQVRETIRVGVAQMAANADHFTMLGVTTESSLEVLNAAYVRLAVQLHPDKMPTLDEATTRDARRLFRHVTTSFAVLRDPIRRASYLQRLGKPAAAERKPAAASAPPPNAASPPADRARAAEDAYQRGLASIRRDDMPRAVGELAQAIELSPTTPSYQAAHAWARFCAASDKSRVADDTRKVLERAIFKSSDPLSARFYLGRVERMLGRAREALHHFREVLVLDPTHAEAAAEIRLLEPRIAHRR